MLIFFGFPLDPWPLWSGVSPPRPPGRLLPWRTTNVGKRSERRVQSPELPGLSYELALFKLNAL
jgi:hypothetical protein